MNKKKKLGLTLSCSTTTNTPSPATLPATDGEPPAAAASAAAPSPAAFGRKQEGHSRSQRERELAKDVLHILRASVDRQVRVRQETRSKKCNKLSADSGKLVDFFVTVSKGRNPVIRQTFAKAAAFIALTAVDEGGGQDPHEIKHLTEFQFFKERRNCI